MLREAQEVERPSGATVLVVPPPAHVCETSGPDAGARVCATSGAGALWAVPFSGARRSGGVGGRGGWRHLELTGARAENDDDMSGRFRADEDLKKEC